MRRDLRELLPSVERQRHVEEKIINEMKHCVQCHKELEIAGEGHYFCSFASCPNYALLAIPEEDMPEEQVLDTNQK